MRILGGSLGISASTVFLHEEVKSKLGRTLQHRSTGITGYPEGSLPPQAFAALQSAYTTAFHRGMVVACAAAGAAMLVTLIGFRRQRQDMLQQRRNLAQQEKMRISANNELEPVSA